MADEIRLHDADPLEPRYLGIVARAGEPLIQGDDFFRELVNALPAAIYTTDPAGRITYFNEAAAALWGCRPDLGKSEWCGSWKLYTPDGQSLPHDQCPMAIAVRERRAIRGVVAVAERPDGSRVTFLPFPLPIYNASGAFVGAVNMLVDITERRDAEVAAQRLAAIVESSDDAIASKDLDGIVTSWNKAAEQIFGYLAEEIIGKSIKTIIPLELHGEEDNVLERVRAGHRIEHYETIRQRKHGGLIEVSLTVSPIRNAQGRIVGASKIARDITERKRSEAQIAMLAREAEHRAKNILATVQATVHLTNADSAEGLKQNIVGRIQALANVHTLFAESRWSGAELRTLVAQELSPYCQKGEALARISGPDLWLDPGTAQTMAVAVHELTTNAAKYGALSVPEGHVDIEWSHDRDGLLRLQWIERGGPPVTPPTHRGFGTRVMESVVRGQLMGEAHFDWRPEGLACEITINTGGTAPRLLNQNL